MVPIRTPQESRKDADRGQTVEQWARKCSVVFSVSRENKRGREQVTWLVMSQTHLLSWGIESNLTNIHRGIRLTDLVDLKWHLSLTIVYCFTATSWISLGSTRKQTAQLSFCVTVIYDAFHWRGWHSMETYAEHLFGRTRSKYQPRAQENVEKYSKRMGWVHHYSPRSFLSVWPLCCQCWL